MKGYGAPGLRWALPKSWSVEGLGFGFWGFGFRVLGLGFGGLFSVECLGFRVQAMFGGFWGLHLKLSP